MKKCSTLQSWIFQFHFFWTKAYKDLQKFSEPVTEFNKFKDLIMKDPIINLRVSHKQLELYLEIKENFDTAVAPEEVISSTKVDKNPNITEFKDEKEDHSTKRVTKGS